MANLQVLVVAGGGQGGFDVGGGGGGGGIVYNSSYSVTIGTKTVTVGGGRQNSVFDSITALAGGNGGGNINPGGNGGSGGGAGYATNNGGTATQGSSGGGTGYGYNGGNSTTVLYKSSGGGGAGGAGVANTSTGNGGVGRAFSISGSSVYYGGGGGGGAIGSAGTGGTGGGGNGNGSGGAGSNGTANTGGGGGGGGASTAGGSGGSGIVIVRYITADFDSVQITGASNTQVVSGSDTICTFYQSGTFIVFEKATKTIISKSNIKKNINRTLTNKSFIVINRQKTITSKARIQTFTTKTFTTKASILSGKYILVKANIKGIVTKTLTSKANLNITSFQSLTSKSDIIAIQLKTINAQACIRNEVYETVRQVAPKIEIQWDGINWVDESTYFLSAQGNEQLSGTDGQGIASTLDVELDNTDDRFTPNNVDSPLYGYIKPRVPIRIETIIGTSFRLFTGYIKNFHPDIKSKICSLECYDNQVLLNNKEANGIVYEDNRTDELLTVLATLAELDPAQYTFEVGLHIVNFGYFENRNVWPVMGELSIAERGRIFFDRYGILRFWNRDHLHNQTSVVTLTQNDWILDLDYSIAEHDIKNYVTVQAKPRASAGIQVVWSNGDVQYLDAYSDTLILIPANASQGAWLELEDPCSTFITPVSGTDFIANSEQDGSGIDLTNNIFVNQFINYGDSVYVNVVNIGSIDAYLIKFQIRGNPAQVLNYIQVNVQDTTSISLYGKQDETIENNFIQDEGSATEIAYEELWRRQDAVNNFDINIMGIPYLLCGDLVSVEYIKGSYNNYLIEQITWTLDSGGFKEKLRLTTPYIFPTIQRIDARAMIVGGHYIKTVTSKGNIT